MVYYRKYRPQTIDELDSQTVRETLCTVLLSPEIPHAFLFTGPKGLGKTSTARIVAKVVNCTKRKKDEYNPCNTCDACISITSGTNMDVLEIDGASNRGIDEIRDLREKVRLAPSSSRKKVYIIDEVHMLTTEAFNALLKTIEEPPSHVMFLFCTTEPQKVPATIVSRCFHINFNRATEGELKRSLQRIAIGENLQVDDDALTLIANLADGGFRDGAKVLEEVHLVSGGKKITKELIEKKFQISNIQFPISNILQSLKEKNTKEALAIVAKLTEEGIDIKYFISQLLEALHELLLKQSDIQRPNWRFEIRNLTFEISEILELVSLLSKAYMDMKFAVIPQLPLEIAVINFCTSKEKEILQSISTVTINDKPTLHGLRKEQQALKVKSILNPTKEEPKKTVESNHVQNAIPQNTDTNKSLLENLIYKTNPYNHSVAAVLRGCKITFVDTKVVIIEAAYKFHKERLDEKKTQEVLEKALKEITGKGMNIQVELRK